MQALFGNVAGGEPDDDGAHDEDARAAEAWARSAVSTSRELAVAHGAGERAPSSGRVDIGALVRALRHGESAVVAPATPDPPTHAVPVAPAAGGASHARKASFAWGAALGLSLAAAIVITPAILRVARTVRDDHARAASAITAASEGAVPPARRGDRAARHASDAHRSPAAAAIASAPPTRVQVVPAPVVAVQRAAPVGPAPSDALAAAVGPTPSDALGAAPMRATTVREAMPAPEAAAAPRGGETPRHRARSTTSRAPTRDVAATETARAPDVPPDNPFDAAGAGAAPAVAPSDTQSPAPGQARDPAAVEARDPASGAAVATSDAREATTTGDAREEATTDAPQAAPSARGQVLAPDLDRLLAGAIGIERAAPAAPAPAEPAPVPTEPAGPSRADVDRALDQARGAVARCAADGQHGTADVRITIAGASGRVTSAVVEGELAGTPAGSCVARALRTATFPPFERPTFTLRYAFRI